MHGLREPPSGRADEFHIFAPDQRGHGESDAATGGYLVWALVLDLVGFVDAIGLDRFDLVGLSLGSRTSMAYALEN